MTKFGAEIGAIENAFLKDQDIPEELFDEENHETHEHEKMWVDKKSRLSMLGKAMVDERAYTSQGIENEYMDI